MTNVGQRIKVLEKKLKNTANLLSQTGQKIKELETQNRSQTILKEKELEEWRQKLETLQQERNQIKKEIKEKVLELEQSQLSNSEKQAKINHLLTENSKELEEVDKLLYDERTNYRQIRDKLISKLCEPCPACQTKEQVIKQKDKKIIYLLGIIWTMLILGFIGWFIWLYWRKKRRYCSCLKKLMSIR